MSYDEYHLNLKETFICLGMSFLLTALIAYVFYHSLYGMVLWAIFLPLCIKHQKASLCQRQKRQLILEFRDGMQAVSAAIMAGYSVENAWSEAEHEVKELHGEHALMGEEFFQMNTAIRMNQQLEKVLADFAERSGCEDIQSFGEVFSFAKRSGGNFSKIIHTTIQRISDKIEVEREIQTVIAAKKLEQNIMNVVPILILLYLNFTTEGFLEPLYGNALGIAVMSISLLVYGGAVYLAEKIMRIQV